jgi:chloramphenicol 3-O-phosphotransferase
MDERAIGAIPKRRRTATEDRLRCARGLTKARVVWLVGVEANDPLSLAGAIGAVIAVCFLGTLIPSWQAGRVDPTTALSAE